MEEGVKEALNEGGTDLGGNTRSATWNERERERERAGPIMALLTGAEQQAIVRFSDRGCRCRPS